MSIVKFVKRNDYSIRSAELSIFIIINGGMMRALLYYKL